MKTYLKSLFSLLSITLVLTTQSTAQGHIDCATILSNDGFAEIYDEYAKTIIRDGYTYTAFSNYHYTDPATEYPVLGGGDPYVGPEGLAHVYTAVFDPNCNQIYGGYISPTSDNDNLYVNDFYLDANNNMVITGFMDGGDINGSDFPSTDGTTNSTGEIMAYLAVVSPTTGVVFSTLPYDSTDNSSFTYSTIGNGSEYYIVGESIASNFPVTIGTPIDGTNGYDGFITKFDASGNIVYTTSIVGSGTDNVKDIIYSGSNIVVVGETRSSDFPTTDGSTYTGNDDHFLSMYDTNGNLIFSTIYGGSARESSPTLVADANCIYVYGNTRSSDFVTTDGSVFIGFTDTYVRKYDLSGNLIFSTLIPGNDDISAEILNGTLYLAYIGNGTQPVVGGEGPFGGDDVWVGQFDSSGLVYSTFYGGAGDDELYGFDVNPSGEIFLYVNSENNANTTDNTSGDGITFVKYNADGTLCAATVLNHPGNLNPDLCLETQGDTIWYVGTAVYTDNNGISTDGTAPHTTYSINFQMSKFVFCPESTPIASDVITPSTQMVCMNALVDQIFGEDLFIDGSSFPQVYLDGILIDQPDIELNYQWQVLSPTNVWIDIPGPLAMLADYSPPPTTVDQSYRRVTSGNECCGLGEISVSNVSTVIVSMDAASDVDAGGTMYTCPGSMITIGGDPSAIGGMAPYTYSWNSGEYTTANPEVTVDATSVYTLVVTDALGCSQADVSTVIVYEADAGPAVDICNSGEVTIGGSALMGLTIVPSGGTPPAGEYSIQYTWMPDDGSLSCTDCPNPIASPSTSTEYTLTSTIYSPDDSFCETVSMVVVGVVEEPAGFDLQDHVVCLGEEIEIGANLPQIAEPPIVAVSQSRIQFGREATVANLTNGDTNTAAGQTPDQSGGVQEWIEIDLGSVVEFNQINISADGFDYHYGLEVSSDGVNYSDLSVEFGYFSGTRLSSSSLTSIPLALTMGRYLRFYSLSNGREVDISELSIENGYTYIWTPGTYLITDGPNATFDAGNASLPSPNPITYTLSASRGNCTYYEQVTVAAIKAIASQDGCGPRFIGTLFDQTPDIPDSYSWSIITDPAITTGTGSFLGSTDSHGVNVSESTGGDVGYEQVVTYTLNGSTATCRDTVIVPPCLDPICLVRPLSGGCLDFDEGSLGLIALPPLGVPEDWTYSWTSNDGAVGLDNYVDQVVNLTDNVTRTYTVTFTNIIDPSTTCEADIEVNSPSNSTPVFDATSPVQACAGGAGVNIGIAANNPGLTYAWTNASFLDTATISNPLATVTRPTGFTVIVTDMMTMCTVVDTVIVETQQIASAGNDFVVCDNAVVPLGNNEELPGYTYSWTPVSADWRNGTGPTNAMPEVFIAADQTFYLEVTDPDGLCSTIDSVMITVDQIPDMPVLPDLMFCPTQTGPLVLGTSDGTSSGANLVPGGYFYLWEGGDFINPNNANTSLYTPLPTFPVRYDLKILTANGCNATTTQTIMPITEQPIVAAQGQTICLGEEIELGNDSNASGTYAWTGNDLDDPTSGNPTFTPTVGGTFTFTVSKTEGMCTSTAEVTVTVRDVATPTLTPQVICEGGSVSIGTTAMTGYQYEWTPTIGLDDPFIANPTFSGTTSTNFTLTVIDPFGCLSQTFTSVTVNPGPDVTITSPDIDICDPLVTELVFGTTIESVDPYSIRWSPATNLDDPFTLNPTFFIPGEGEYEYILEVIDQGTGCSIFASTNININASPPRINNANATNPTTCGGSDGSIALAFFNVPNGTYTINYTDGVPSAQTFTNVMVSGGSATISGVSAGTYNDLTITVEGCTSTENVDLSLTDPSDPTLAATSSDPTICGSSDGSISLTLTDVPDGTYTIDYMDAVPSAQTFTSVAVSGGSATISGLSAGTYNDLTITALACTSLEDVDIMLSDPATATAMTSSTAETCALSDGSVQITITGGTSPFNFSWDDSNGNSGNSLNETSPFLISNLPAGMYSVTVIDNIGCSIITSETVMAPVGCCASITNPTPTQSICDGQNVTSLEVSTDGTSSIDFVYFTTPQTGSDMYSGGTSLGVAAPSGGTATINNVSFPNAGQFYIYGIISPSPTDGTCRPNAEIIVQVNALPDVGLVVADPEICGEQEVEIMVMNSQIGVQYQLQDATDNSDVGSPVTGNGSTIVLSVPTALGAGSYVYNIVATNSASNCMVTLTDQANVTIQECDFPEEPPVDCIGFDPCHVISADLYLGTQSSADTGSGTSDDNDGVIFPNNIQPGGTINLPVTIFNNTTNDAYLTAWIDWNGDGDFEDAGEQIANETYVFATNSGSFTDYIEVTIPTDAIQGALTYALFRLSTDNVSIMNVCSDTGSCAVDGEVEVFDLTITCKPNICIPPTIQINRSN